MTNEAPPPQVKERPILFSAEMIRALRTGRKTQTRRVCKHLEWIDTGGAVYMGKPVENYWRFKEKTGSFPFEAERHMAYLLTFCPYGQPGDRLWVRETTCIAPKRFATPDDTCRKDYDGDWRYVSYKADGHSEDAMRDYGLKWTPSIHVPRWASRLTLEVTGVRVERLQDISEADAVAEGIEVLDAPGSLYRHYGEPFAESTSDDPRSGMVFSAKDSYQTLWESINGPGSWELNPWVWVVEFKVGGGAQ